MAIDLSMKKILFPTDYSPQSNGALRHAVAFARQQDSALLVVHVRPPSVPPGGTAVSTDDANRDQADFLTLLSNVTQEGQRPVAHELRTLSGDPAPEIVDLARREAVEAIVMAASGRSGLRRMLMGSVAEAVLRNAPCPVLTIRAGRDGEREFASLVRKREADETPEGRAAELEAQVAARSGAMDLLARAVALRASDIHIDARGDDVEVRLRIDGRLERYCTLGRSVGHTLSTQLKVSAGLDIADPFHPQEGHFEFGTSPDCIEARLTIVPVVGGEALAIRLLDRENLLRPLDRLGLTDQSLAKIHRMLQRGEGVVLATGPAGSGKTTTVFSMLRAIDHGKFNIVTIEDPPEFHVAGLRQMAVDPRHAVTMTSGLRALLRMDPDIVLVGEVRDAETAEIAMRAASSGKYVFTTLHTRDVASTITALRDLHIDNRSLAGNLTGIISQRLVRRLCLACRRETPLEETYAGVFAAAGLPVPEKLYAARGCPECKGRGYRGRIGIFEVMLPSRDICECIERSAPEGELRDSIRAQGTGDLLADGLTKVRDGITTLDEVRSMTWVPFPA